jgi:hypothetical protein
MDRRHLGFGGKKSPTFLLLLGLYLTANCLSAPNSGEVIIIQKLSIQGMMR